MTAFADRTVVTIAVSSVYMKPTYSCMVASLKTRNKKKAEVFNAHRPASLFPSDLFLCSTECRSYKITGLSRKALKLQRARDEKQTADH